MEIREYKGWLMERSYGEGEALYLVDDPEPLVERIKNDMCRYGKYLTVRYFISNIKMSKEQANENLNRTVMGETDAKIKSRYSDITGYLWTDEELNVGGHDLIGELYNCKDKYMIMEIEFYKNKNDIKQTKWKIED